MTRDVLDLAVIGAGPAGITAAARAAEAGRRVVLLDMAPRPGGQIWRHRSRAELPAIARRWLERLDASGAEVMTSASVVDAETDRSEGGGEPGPGSGCGSRGRGRARTDIVFDLFADQVVLATGARELFLPFPGWTLPNVFGVGGAQALLESGASFAGKTSRHRGLGSAPPPGRGRASRAGARRRDRGRAGARLGGGALRRGALAFAGTAGRRGSPPRRARARRGTRRGRGLNGRTARTRSPRSR